ncbi:MAG: universal stress protein [Bacteroidota bacterium]|nr:universal stress protein [Bacteroidota bacterium]
MKRILVPVDFSPTSEKALRFAVDIASKANGTVILYHVYIPVGSTFIGTEETRKQYNTQTEANLLKRLQRFKKKVIQTLDEPSVAAVIGRSPIIDNILGFAEANQADMIVMGTQGATGLKKKIIGSTAARIIEQSDIPTLLVPEKFEWKEPEHFVFATNYQQADRKALTLTVALAKIYNAAVTVVHLLDPYLQFSAKQQADFSEYAFVLQRTFSDCNLKFKELKTTEVADTMEKLDDEIRHDVLVMVRRKKDFLERLFAESLTKNMAYIAKKPLLVVPEEE